MKLGVCYMVFDGEELLEYAAKSIRPCADHISVTWQNTSYHGNQNDSDIGSLVDRLKSNGLIDQDIYFEPDLKLHPKDNELKLRNIGLAASREAGCTHHISLDVDEFILPEQLNYAKQTFGDNDYSIIQNVYYYKKPTWRMTPDPRNNIVSFIHPISSEYSMINKYPHAIEVTRRITPYDRCRVYGKDECIMHHMTYVRKNISKKMKNSVTGWMYNINKFVEEFNNYQLGDRLAVSPDFITKRTTLVDNTFGIEIGD